MHRAIAGNRQMIGRNRRGLRLFVTGQQHPAAPHQLADQGGLPVTPDARPGGQRVGLGQNGQQLQQHRITVERLHDTGRGGRIREITVGRRRGQQQMVANHGREQPDIGGPQAQPLSHPDSQVGADLAVIPPAPLPDIVQQGAQHQQVGSRDSGRESTGARDGFDQVTVHGPDVDRIPRWKIPYGAPLREDPAPQTRPVQGLDGGHRRRAGAEQYQQIIECVARPGRA